MITCLFGQYVDGLACVNIPSECAEFDATLKICRRCQRGYTTNDGGECIRVLCPPGKVPAGVLDLCRDVSPLCATYDDITGDCLTCQDSAHTVVDGACRQIASPLAGCLGRQRFGFGACLNSDINCKIYNLGGLQCIECFPDFYISYRGICAPNAVCGRGQQSINGQCILLPDNCLAGDANTGFCTRCANEEFQIIYGQCVPIKKCEPGFYLNDNGACVLVSPDCDLFHPSNGQCITCKNKNINPSGGLCCP